MLIKTDLTRLTRDEIVYLLEESGYNESSNDIIRTEFTKVTIAGNIQYKMEYYDINRNLRSDYVYVFISNEGKLTADY